MSLPEALGRLSPGAQAGARVGPRESCGNFSSCLGKSRKSWITHGPSEKRGWGGTARAPHPAAEGPARHPLLQGAATR
eukprot:7060837-Pyramimonas_sp.AAC.1